MMEEVVISCVDRIKSVAEDFREAIDAAHAGGPDREDLDADICLASRAIYGRFKNWVEFYNQIDPEAEAILKALFEEALAVLNPNLKYHAIVEKRFKRFTNKCNSVREGHMTSQFLSASQW
jgi:hypothetical protein